MIDDDIPITAINKKCNKCKKNKNLEDFNIDNNARDGLCYTCKECKKLYLKIYRNKLKETGKYITYYNKETQRSYREKNKDKLLEKQRRWREKNRERHNLIHNINFSKKIQDPEFRKAYNEKKKLALREKRKNDPVFAEKCRESVRKYAAKVKALKSQS